jgi:hypothetical protein
VAGLSLVLLASCASGTRKAAPPSATVGTAAPTTTTTDPYAVPAVIDAAYVNRVLAGLDAGVGDVVRMVVATKTIPREAYDRLRALYATDAMLQFKIDSFQSDLADNLPGYRSTPGNKITTVASLLSTSSRCIYAKVSRDYAAVSVAPNPNLATQWVAIQPLDPSRDPNHYNSVRWAYVYDGFERGFLPPSSDPCGN